ncbi:putative rhamnogalacturonase [Aspergillus puulaauensis]|uniref:rhamnogalacturonan endolyase n=1 Tax=Aspergillus puulaauensis TaxID=1220207 RepID=A0A7R7XFU1_9EURO|nr:uncharacterized protein APUU_20306S [Aspergillus puulaauensis]BCS19874.1 hypothetical protein APUU_20306S [Aspergillus puulaauensis]
MIRSLVSIAALLLGSGSALTITKPPARGPFLDQVDNNTWIIGNELWNLTQGPQYGVKLFYKDHDCVGDAFGHYVSYNGAASDLAWTSASVVSEGRYKGARYIDVKFTAQEGDFHWVIFSGLAGAYQYFVNHALPPLGEFRTLWRLDNSTFTHGKTNLRDEELPHLEDYLDANYVQDSTWLKPDGSGYITKYDFTSWVRTLAYYGVYGQGFGSWYINAGKDYFNGNHLKQELLVHRESDTGDSVQLNMIHGTHYQVSTVDHFADGRTWGPWLWYLNEGSHSDVSRRAQQEFAEWPYPWLKDKAYQARGTVKGTLKLSDGRRAAHAAVFLGDNHPNKSALDQGAAYYYTGYTDARGAFEFKDVRAATYGLQAWSNGSKLADVTTSFLQNDVVVQAGKTANLRSLDWAVSRREKVFQIGDFDRTSYGFHLGGAPYTHALSEECPADLLYAVGQSTSQDWCFVQTHLGNWTITFDAAAPAEKQTAMLIVSLAGYASGTSSTILANGVKIGNLTSDTPPLRNDGTIYRSATTAGEWRYFEFPFDASLLRETENEITFQVTKSSTWKGFLWDSVVLEW